MGATPPEEIAQQHAEACAILEEARASTTNTPSSSSSSSSSCFRPSLLHAPPRVDRGEVPLRWKQRPTCINSGSSDSSSTIATATATSTATNADNNPVVLPGNSVNPNSPDESVEVLVVTDEKKEEDDDDDHHNHNKGTVAEWCISSRGQVDVTPIVKLIQEGVNEPAALSASSSAAESTTTTTRTRNRTTTSESKKIMSKKNGARKSFSSKSNNATSKVKQSFSWSNLWNEENAARNNVSITRPSHDAWGIKKIVLVFCDDFLHTIYTLPWYQQQQRQQEQRLDNNNNTKNTNGNGGSDVGTIGSQMHSAIQPILDTLQIHPSQLVRCLLAALPPGVTIPVHHDTGEWVKHTHRIHVPIIVPDATRVLFRCGLTEPTLDRVDCTPGHVFEMNNQAKHAVTNAMPANYRVHLILDYVDPSFFAMRSSQNCPVRRIALNPGEIITQTRRSIDRALDANERTHPAYLILGAQKAGTTSLYEYINQHPWVVRAKRRETHCLDWRWNSHLASTEERREYCLNDYYHAESMGAYPSLITGDSTPSYLLDYWRVIPRVKEVFDHDGLRFVVMTRDPIKRAVSHYKMVTSKDGTPEQLAVRGSEWRTSTLEEVFEKDICDMKEDGLLPYWDVENKTFDREVFDTFANSREEDEAWERYVTTRVPLNTGSYAPLARGMYALQCRRWFRSFDRKKFLVMKLEDMSSSSGDDAGGGGGGGKGEQWAVDRTMEHLGLPRFTVPDVEVKNKREYRDPLEGRGELREWLERFFAPHNERFGRMLVEELGYEEEDWINAWSY